LANGTKAYSAIASKEDDGTLYVAVVNTDRENDKKLRVKVDGADLTGKTVEVQTLAGESISMSILLRPQITPNQAPMLTLVMACSVAEGIMDCKDVCGEQQIQIKWPNDIIIHGKKLVGILTEMSTQIDYINHVTVGVGINVNLTDFPEEIREHATSLRLECGHKVKRAPLIAAIMKRLEENYALFMETGDLSQLMEKYSELLVNKDRDVMILGAKEQYVAHALGINKTGELIVRKEDGTIEEVYAGEVSVRGVYGYV